MFAGRKTGCAVVVLVVGFMLSGEVKAGDVPGDKGEALGRVASDLIQRCLAVNLPMEMPRALVRGVGAELQEEAEEAYEGMRVDPASRCVQWDLLRFADRKLYRDLKRFWKKKGTDRLAAVPYLANRYFEGGDEYRMALLRFIASIIDDVGHDHQAERRRIAEPFYLDVLEKGPDDENRKIVLEGYLSNLIPLGDVGLARLIGVAEGRDAHRDEYRAREIRIIKWSASSRQVGEETVDYLLGVASGDSCAACQASAIGVGMVERYGKERVLPVYLRTLTEHIEEGGHVLWESIRAVGIYGRYPEAVPALICALDSGDVRGQRYAISALERTTGENASGLGYEREKKVLVHPSFGEQPPEVVEAVKAIAAKWKEWWRREGGRYLAESGLAPVN